MKDESFKNDENNQQENPAPGKSSKHIAKRQTKEWLDSLEALEPDELLGGFRPQAPTYAYLEKDSEQFMTQQMSKNSFGSFQNNLAFPNSEKANNSFKTNAFENDKTFKDSLKDSKPGLFKRKNKNESLFKKAPDQGNLIAIAQGQQNKVESGPVIDDNLTQSNQFPDFVATDNATPKSVNFKEIKSSPQTNTEKKSISQEKNQKSELSSNQNQKSFKNKTESPEISLNDIDEDENEEHFPKKRLPSERLSFRYPKYEKTDESEEVSIISATHVYQTPLSQLNEGIFQDKNEKSISEASIITKSDIPGIDKPNFSLFARTDDEKKFQHYLYTRYRQVFLTDPIAFFCEKFETEKLNPTFYMANDEETVNFLILAEFDKIFKIYPASSSEINMINIIKFLRRKNYNDMILFKEMKLQEIKKIDQEFRYKPFRYTFKMQKYGTFSNKPIIRVCTLTNENFFQVDPKSNVVKREFTFFKKDLCIQSKVEVKDLKTSRSKKYLKSEGIMDWLDNPMLEGYYYRLIVTGEEHQKRCMIYFREFWDIRMLRDSILVQRMEYKKADVLERFENLKKRFAIRLSEVFYENKLKKFMSIDNLKSINAQEELIIKKCIGVYLKKYFTSRYNISMRKHQDMSRTQVASIQEIKNTEKTIREEEMKELSPKKISSSNSGKLFKKIIEEKSISQKNFDSNSLRKSKSSSNSKNFNEAFASKKSICNNHDTSVQKDPQIEITNLGDYAETPALTLAILSKDADDQQRETKPLEFEDDKYLKDIIKNKQSSDQTVEKTSERITGKMPEKEIPRRSSISFVRCLHLKTFPEKTDSAEDSLIKYVSQNSKKILKTTNLTIECESIDRKVNLTERNFKSALYSLELSEKNSKPNQCPLILEELKGNLAFLSTEGFLMFEGEEIELECKELTTNRSVLKTSFEPLKNLDFLGIASWSYSTFEVKIGHSSHKCLLCYQVILFPKSLELAHIMLPKSKIQENLKKFGSVLSNTSDKISFIEHMEPIVKIASSKENYYYFLSNNNIESKLKTDVFVDFHLTNSQILIHESREFSFLSEIISGKFEFTENINNILSNNGFWNNFIENGLSSKFRHTFSFFLNQRHQKSSESIYFKEKEIKAIIEVLQNLEMEDQSFYPVFSLTIRCYNYLNQLKSSADSNNCSIFNFSLNFLSSIEKTYQSNKHTLNEDQIECICLQRIYTSTNTKKSERMFEKISQGLIFFKVFVKKIMPDVFNMLTAHTYSYETFFAQMLVNSFSDYLYTPLFNLFCDFKLVFEIMFHQSSNDQIKSDLSKINVNIGIIINILLLAVVLKNNLEIISDAFTPESFIDTLKTSFKIENQKFSEVLQNISNIFLDLEKNDFFVNQMTNINECGVLKYENHLKAFEDIHVQQCETKINILELLSALSEQPINIEEKKRNSIPYDKSNLIFGSIFEGTKGNDDEKVQTGPSSLSKYSTIVALLDNMNLDKGSLLERPEFKEICFDNSFKHTTSQLLGILTQKGNLSTERANKIISSFKIISKKSEHSLLELILLILITNSESKDSKTKVFEKLIQELQKKSKVPKSSIFSWIISFISLFNPICQSSTPLINTTLSIQSNDCFAIKIGTINLKTQIIDATALCRKYAKRNLYFTGTKGLNFNNEFCQELCQILKSAISKEDNEKKIKIKFNLFVEYFMSGKTHIFNGLFCLRFVPEYSIVTEDEEFINISANETGLMKKELEMMSDISGANIFINSSESIRTLDPKNMSIRFKYKFTKTAEFEVSLVFSQQCEGRIRNILTPFSFESKVNSNILRDQNFQILIPSSFVFLPLSKLCLWVMIKLIEEIQKDKIVDLIRVFKNIERIYIGNDQTISGDSNLVVLQSEQRWSEEEMIIFHVELN